MMGKHPTGLKYSDPLKSLTCSELKGFLRKNNLPLSGGKDDPIKRLHDNVSIDA